MKPFVLNDNIAYLTGQFNKEFSNTMTKKFHNRGYEVTSEQFSMLTQLWNEDGITQKVLSDRSGRDKTTISRVIDGMIKRGLIQRIKSDEDKRSRRIHLTEKGKDLQPELVKMSGELFMKSLQNIQSQDMHIAVSVLSRMLQNLK